MKHNNTSPSTRSSRPRFVVAATLAVTAGFGGLFLLASKFGYVPCQHKCNVTDDDVAMYGAKCLANAVPPWPICLFGGSNKPASKYVQHAKDSATRCCGADTSECKCPHQDSWRYKGRIEQWCDAVATCPDGARKGGGVVEQEDKDKDGASSEQAATTATIGKEQEKQQQRLRNFLLVDDMIE